MASGSWPLTQVMVHLRNMLTSPHLVGLSMGPFTNWMHPDPQPVVSPWACSLPSQKYPIEFVSPSLDWLAWRFRASIHNHSRGCRFIFNSSCESLQSIGYFCDGRGQAQGLTTGCGSEYIRFVTGPLDRPTRGRDPQTPGLHGHCFGRSSVILQPP